MSKDKKKNNVVMDTFRYLRDSYVNYYWIISSWKSLRILSLLR